MLAPAAVRALLGAKPLGGTSQDWVGPRNTGGAQALHRMEDGIGEVNAPGAGKGAVRALAAVEKADTTGKRRLDCRAQHLRMRRSEMRQCTQRRTGALHI